MSEKKVALILSHMAQEAAPGGDIDLWPALRSRLLTSATIPRKGSRMLTQQTQSHRLRLAVLVMLIILIATGIVITTPQGKVLAQNVLRFFTRTESNLQPPHTTTVALVEVTPGMGALTPTENPAGKLAFEDECGKIAAPHCTTEQIQSRVSFPIFIISELPEGLQFSGVTGGPDAVWLQYSTGPHSDGLLLVERKIDAGQPGGLVGADASIQTVRIGDVEGEWVKGAWHDGPEGAVWDPDTKDLTLSWEQNGLMFTISAFGNTFQTEDLIAFAAGLQSDQDMVPRPTTNPTWVTDEVVIEDLSGFDVQTPAEFFPDYKLTHYTYTPAAESVCLHYLYAPLEYEFHPVIYLLQSPTLSVDPGMGEEPQPVAIDGADNSQGWIYFTHSGPIPSCDNAPFWGGPLITWQLEGMTYQIYAATDPFGPGYVSNQDLIEMAETLSGSDPSGTNTPDPLNLRSISDAQIVAGFPVKAPSKLPPGAVFSHALYNEETHVLSLIYTGLRIHQDQGAADPRLLCDLQAPIPLEEIQVVQVNGTPAQYAQGDWGYDPATNQVTEWLINVSSGHLAWQADGIGYCITGSFYIPTAQQTLIEIAESMK